MHAEQRDLMAFDVCWAKVPNGQDYINLSPIHNIVKNNCVND